MAYRVSLESGTDEAIEEVDCEDWAAFHAALDKWHSQVHFSGRYHDLRLRKADLV